MAEFTNVSRPIFADALRGAGGLLAAQPRAQGTISLAGFGAAPPRVINNVKGRMWNNIKDAAAGAVGVLSGRAEAAQAEAQAAAQQHALSEAMSGEGMTPEKLIKLRSLGIDTDTLKMAFPEEDKLGMNQILQYGQTAAGMRKVNALKPGAFSDEAIAQAEAAEAAALADERGWDREKALLGRSPREPRAPSDMERYLRASEEERAIMDRFRGKGGSGGGGGKGVYTDAQGRRFDSKGNELKSPEQMADEGMNTAKRVRDILASPDADEQLFSNKAIGRTFVKNVGDQDSNSLFNAAARTAATALEPPLAMELRNIGIENVMNQVQKLYPATDRDVALLMSTTPQAGQNRESMAKWVDIYERINSRIASGDLKPIDQGEAGESDEELLNMYSLEGRR